MRSFVINLKSAPERLAHMRSEFERIGVEFERFDAVDGRVEINNYPMTAVLPPMLLRPRSPRELGCLLSHYELWRLIASGFDEYGAVFEDDLFVDRRLPLLLASQLPKTADLIKLEALRKRPFLSRKAFKGPAESTCTGGSQHILAPQRMCRGLLLLLWPRSWPVSTSRSITSSSICTTAWANR